MDRKSIYIIMGVSGCGKTTIGKLLAKALQVPFFDGDDFHSKANVAKMEGGTPLNDEDRKGWLQSLNALAVSNIEKGAVIACSALKETHRLLLKEDIETKLIFVHLLGTFDSILARLKERKNHYMPIDLLKSQLDILEPPIDAITVSIANTPEKIVSKIVELTK